MSLNVELNESFCENSETDSVGFFECKQCKERENTSVTVDSMVKWISSLEDKVTTSFSHIEEMLLSIKEQQDVLATRNKDLVRCNRQLAEKLSEILFKREFKQRKIVNPLAEEVIHGALHSTVIPFVYLEK